MDLVPCVYAETSCCCDITMSFLLNVINFLFRSAFLAAHIPLFLYPFLHTVSKTRPFEYLRLTSLGVIGKLSLLFDRSVFIKKRKKERLNSNCFVLAVGALVKTDEQEVINFLLTTEIIPLCLRIMESGSELSKTVRATIRSRVLDYY